MKKKLYREKYYGNDTKITAEKAIELIDKAIENIATDDKAGTVKVKKITTKKGKKKND